MKLDGELGSFFFCLLFYIFEVFHNKTLKGKETVRCFKAPHDQLIE